jgi:hypothetical protein
MEVNKAPYGMPAPRTLLRQFKEHLGLTLGEMAEYYGINYRTLRGWLGPLQSGGPDLRNHTQLLVDLFGWYLRISPDKLKRKRIAQRVQELAQTKYVLNKYKRYLGINRKEFSLLYTVPLSLCEDWLGSSKSGAPDLKNNPVLLRDFFKWYFENKLEEGKPVLEACASNVTED